MYCVETYQGIKLTRTSSGNTQPLSSMLTEPLWTDPGQKRGISVRELISTWKKNETTAGGERIVEPSPQIIASEGKATTTATTLAGVRQ